MPPPPTNPFTADDVEVVSRERVFSGYLKIDRYALRHRRFQGDWSDEVIREVCVRGVAVAVLPYDPVRDRVVLIEQFRMAPYAMGGAPWMFEIVAGMREDNEALEVVALRETVEEIGRSVDRLLPIARYYPSPAVSAEELMVYCGRIDSDGMDALGGQADEEEDIRISVHDFAAVRDDLMAGKFDNAATLIALQWLVINHDSLRQSWLTTEQP